MARKATAKSDSRTKKAPGKSKASQTGSAGAARRSSGPGGEKRKSASQTSAADALIKLLESPLVADLLAVGATAALAAITESRSGRRDDPTYRSSRTLKAAGKAAAAAMGRRLATEVEEIRRAAKDSTGRRQAKGRGGA